MRLIFSLILLCFLLPCYADVITGEVTKDTTLNKNIVYDSLTNTPIEGVVIKIPSKNLVTKTEKDGSFKLQTNITGPTIMALEKDGYKPFSMTLNDNLKNPIQVGIEKTTPLDIIVDTKMIHLGDDSFSYNSANASEFSVFSIGSFYTQDFKIKPIKSNEEVFLVIGSIIGIDTSVAQRLGQSHVKTAFSSPPEVYFNNNKIAEININGDNQKIIVPKNLIFFNKMNNLTIKAGRNLHKVTSIDFDDIEFTNILFEIK